MHTVLLQKQHSIVIMKRNKVDDPYIQEGLRFTSRL